MKQKPRRGLSPVEVQRTAIRGLMGDNELGEQLCLKGGNALALIYGVSERFSQDIDFSMAEDFEELEASRVRIEKALKVEFQPRECEVFDVRLESKPKKIKESKWGGYSLTFKVIESEKKDELTGIDDWRRNAIQIGEKGKVEVDISKFEYTASISYELLDNVEVKVLSLTAILYEKIRAICQQMPNYSKRTKKTPRARDFYDIHQIVEKKPDLNFLDSGSLKHCRSIFETKEVSKDLLLEIESQRDFHREDWVSVIATIAEQPESFDHYFDYVCELANNLHAHWDE